MVIRFPIIAATFMAASISIGTVLGAATPASAQEVITCSSRDNQRNTCSVPGRGRVRFIRQLSNASCRDNWGYRGNRIWVRNGCRAEFAVGNGRNGRYDRDDRYNRNGRYDRGDRYNRNGRYDRDDRYDRNGRYDRDDRYDRNDRYDRDDRYYR
ncbi:DUF3011 domain-containing protein [Nostoc piscinale]|uniref:DUF3011 domain-containing protein n=1 Tax=Nostoc piscinale TaxID=224012 RepID=UPI0039A4F027